MSAFALLTQQQPVRAEVSKPSLGVGLPSGRTPQPPFGLSLSKPSLGRGLSLRRMPADSVRTEPVEVPFGFGMSCSLREAAPGLGPAADPLSFRKKGGKETAPVSGRAPRDSSAVLGLEGGLRQTRSVPFGHCDSNMAQSQKTKRASHAAFEPCAPRRLQRGERANEQDARFAREWDGALPLAPQVADEGGLRG
jgi:hypothetical protein